MELPHLSLYIRRALRRPSNVTMYIVMLWAAMFAATLTSDALVMLPAYYWLDPFGIGELCGLIGNLILYWVIARQMTCIARDELGRAPDWYPTPLSDGSALLGALTTTGLAALLPLTLLVAFSLLNGHLHSISWTGYGPVLWFSLFRLVHFALLAGCLQLALRRSILSRAVPLMLAITAAVVTFWDVILPYHHYLPSPVLDNPLWIAVCLSSTLVVLYAVQQWLATLPAQSGRWASSTLVLAILLGIPALFVVSGYLDVFTDFEYVHRLGFEMHCLFNALYSYIYPDIYALLPLDFGDYPPAACLLYGWQTTIPVAVAILTAAYAAALALWWLAACRCLRAARTSDAPSH